MLAWVFLCAFWVVLWVTSTRWWDCVLIIMKAVGCCLHYMLMRPDGAGCVLFFCVITGPLWILLLVLLWWKQEEMKTKPTTWERAKQLRGVFALLTPSTEIQQSSRITQRLRQHLSSITRSPTCLHKRLHKMKCLWKLKPLLQTHWAP